jgi:hypothetical protein
MGSVWPAAQACCASRKLDDDVEEGEPAADGEREVVVAVPWDREPPMEVPRSDSRDSRMTTLPADLASPRAAEKRWTRAGPSAPPPLRAGLFEPVN